MTSSPPHSATRRYWPRFSPGFVALWRHALLGIAIFHMVAQLCYSLPMEMARTDVGRDLDIYYDAAVRLKQGVDVYQPWPEYGVQMTPSRFFYSPPFLLLVRPMAELARHDYERVWLVLMTGAFWVYAFCLGRLASGKWEWQSGLIWGLFADTIFQGHNVLSIGQFEPFMWMLFGLALTTRSRAGCLALATMGKIHPLWALCIALSQDKARAWKNAALFAIPVLILSFIVVGGHNWAMWWPSTQPVASQGTYNFFNWSLSFLGLRVLTWCGLLIPRGTFPLWAKAYLSLCAVGGPLATAYFARRQSPEMRLSLVACAGILFAPLCWLGYLALLLLPIAVGTGQKRAVKLAQQQ